MNVSNQPVLWLQIQVVEGIKLHTSVCSSCTLSISITFLLFLPVQVPLKPTLFPKILLSSWVLVSRCSYTDSGRCSLISFCKLAKMHMLVFVGALESLCVQWVRTLPATPASHSSIHSEFQLLRSPTSSLLTHLRK